MHHMIQYTSQIKLRRAELGIGTTALAHRLGVHQSSVVRLEQSEAAGSISLDSLRRAAAALGCALEYRLAPTLDEKLAPLKKRNLRSSRRRRRSSVSDALAHEQASRVRSLSPSERILEACALSEIAGAMCSPKR